MAVIDKLTDAQIARFPEFVKRWTDIGLCTDPADRPRAEQAIRRMYECGGLNPPARIVWCGSPLSQGMTRAIILDKKLIKGVGDSVGASVGDSVWASVRDSVGDSVRASVWASVRDSVGDSVGASVGDSVGASVWASVRASVWASVRASVWDSVYGAHDAVWLAFYSYFREVCTLTEQTAKLEGLNALAESAGWALPHANICWVSERHNLLMRDERGRLHNIAGPACAYPDGWAIYAVNGIRVPADIIENRESITIPRIKAEQNAEQRRIMIELMGLERWVRDSGMRAVHEDNAGKLYRLDSGEQFVEVVNSTPEPNGDFKHYFLPVGPSTEITTAMAGVAETFGLNKETYAAMLPLMRQS